MSVLGLVTIGQAPRVDVTPDILPILSGVEVVEHGALDDLDATGIAALRPVGDEEVVVSRLRGGGSATMSERRVLPHVQRALGRAIADGADAVLVLCTGSLPGLDSSVPLYTAEQLARGGAHAIVGGGRLGVLAPEPAQCAPIAERWRTELGRDVLIRPADPYTASPCELAEAGRALAGHGADWIFMDCIGYSEAMAATVAAASGVRALTARSVAARLVAAAL